MKIKLKNKENPVPNNLVFRNTGHCLTLIDEINSGKQVEVDRVSKPASEYVEEVKTNKKKGGSPKGDK
tara:strand:+ start:10831 stop:11034 length:204 start_codon:yes stop_codon:yes gene_type:complete